MSGSGGKSSGSDIAREQASHDQTKGRHSTSRKAARVALDSEGVHGALKEGSGRFRWNTSVVPPSEGSSEHAKSSCAAPRGAGDAVGDHGTQQRRHTSSVLSNDEHEKEKASFRVCAAVGFPVWVLPGMGHAIP